MDIDEPINIIEQIATYCKITVSTDGKSQSLSFRKIRKYPIQDFPVTPIFSRFFKESLFLGKDLSFFIEIYL